MTDFIKHPVRLPDIIGKGIATNEQEQNKYPCHVVKRDGGFVTVHFDITGRITLPERRIPIAMYEYVRMPVAVGDKGFAVAVDVNTGNQTGLGGTATIQRNPSNLTSLVFVPMSDKGYGAGFDDDKLYLYARKAGALVTVAEDKITLKVGGAVLTITDGRIESSVPIYAPDFIGGGISLKTHKHPDPQGGQVGQPI